MNILPLDEAITQAEQAMLEKGVAIHSNYWQALDISNKPEAEMVELLFYDFSSNIPRTNTALAKLTQPNLPWAEEHFLERISGLPLNPGEMWKYWPWSNSADTHRTEEGKFSHTYMERYWPKPLLSKGIRYQTGDLNDVINLFERDPNTRQAYLPVFFPEDTGSTAGVRIPCSIGYHFILRDHKLHCTYHLRSCDLYRHFRDDIYLTARLIQHVSNELFNRFLLVNSPGILTVIIGSLHLFINDYHALEKRVKKISG